MDKIVVCTEYEIPEDLNQVTIHDLCTYVELIRDYQNGYTDVIVTPETVVRLLRFISHSDKAFKNELKVIYIEEFLIKSASVCLRHDGTLIEDIQEFIEWAECWMDANVFDELANGGILDLEREPTDEEITATQDFEDRLTACADSIQDAMYGAFHGLTYPEEKIRQGDVLGFNDDDTLSGREDMCKDECKDECKDASDKCIDYNCDTCNSDTCDCTCDCTCTCTKAQEER